jgi:hypothetical protein
MGIEYSLRFHYEDPAKLRGLLRRLPFVGPITEDGAIVELRQSQTSGMPDAMLMIEPEGLYYCDNGGDGRMLLGAVLAKLVSEFTSSGCG